MQVHHLHRRILRTAAHSPCRHKVVAVGYNARGVIINITYNRPRFYSVGGGWHAEELLIYQTSKALRSITIARVSKRGNLLPISPCVRCTKLATRRGITIKEYLP